MRFLISLTEPAEVLRRVATAGPASWYVNGSPEWLPTSAEAWAKRDFMSLELVYLSGAEEVVRTPVPGADGCVAYLGANSGRLFGIDKPWKCDHSFAVVSLYLSLGCNYAERSLHYRQVYEQLSMADCEVVLPQ